MNGFCSVFQTSVKNQIGFHRIFSYEQYGLIANDNEQKKLLANDIEPQFGTKETKKKSSQNVLRKRKPSLFKEYLKSCAK